MNADSSYPYATFLDIKFPALAVVDASALIKACTDQWYNQTLCKVNESVVRLGRDARRISLAQARQR